MFAARPDVMFTLWYFGDTWVPLYLLQGDAPLSELLTPVSMTRIVFAPSFALSDVLGSYMEQDASPLLAQMVWWNLQLTLGHRYTRWFWLVHGTQGFPAWTKIGWEVLVTIFQWVVWDFLTAFFFFQGARFVRILTPGWLEAAIIWMLPYAAVIWCLKRGVDFLFGMDYWYFHGTGAAMLQPYLEALPNWQIRHRVMQAAHTIAFQFGMFIGMVDRDVNRLLGAQQPAEAPLEAVGGLQDPRVRLAPNQQAPILHLPPDVPADGDDDRCAICYANKRVAAFVPCGHICACMTCTRAMLDGPTGSLKCPTCNAPVTEVLRVYGQPAQATLGSSKQSPQALGFTKQTVPAASNTREPAPTHTTAAVPVTPAYKDLAGPGEATSAAAPPAGRRSRSRSVSKSCRSANKPPFGLPEKSGSNTNSSSASVRRRRSSASGIRTSPGSAQ